ncbi:hypothetical protein PoB_001863100 [Plakobranchus ocellatus]|uniref:Secreted protein n=1 Tax=Plakobranchus ocellatus TaxID=259542 RepID=A0AAV3ZBT2_9GAST|nr:hypothetical protein PoB_001863100 [Plakobranchus ocellatus]
MPGHLAQNVLWFLLNHTVVQNARQALTMVFLFRNTYAEFTILYWLTLVQFVAKATKRSQACTIMFSPGTRRQSFVQFVRKSSQGRVHLELIF